MAPSHGLVMHNGSVQSVHHLPISEICVVCEDTYDRELDVLRNIEVLLVPTHEGPPLWFRA